jgi:hypothetical protein
VKRLFLLALVGGIVALAIKEFPPMRRYLRIERM